MHRQNLVASCLFALLITTTVSPMVSGTENNYSLSVENSIEMPARTVSIGGEEHVVSAVGRVTPETLSVTVDAPSDVAYDVLLYNGDRQIVTSKEGTGPQSVQFDMTRYAPGSYLLSIYKDGDYKAVYPVIVRGYTVAVDAPTRAAPNSDIAISVTAKQVESVEDPSSVTIVLANGDQSVRATATKETDNKYQATVSLEQFQSRTVRIYAVVQGSDDAFKEGRNELLGISDASTLTISQETTRTTTKSPDSSPTTEPTATRTTSTTATTTSSTTATTTVSTTPSTTSTKTSSQRTTETSTQALSPTLSTSTTTTSSVITPARSTTFTQTTPAQGIPGFGIGGCLVALCCLLILAFRR